MRETEGRRREESEKSAGREKRAENLAEGRTRQGISTLRYTIRNARQWQWQLQFGLFENRLVGGCKNDLVLGGLSGEEEEVLA